MALCLLLHEVINMSLKSMWMNNIVWYQNLLSRSKLRFFHYLSGWVAGWVYELKIRLNSASVGVELKLKLKLSLAIL